MFRFISFPCDSLSKISLPKHHQLHTGTYFEQHKYVYGQNIYLLFLCCISYYMYCKIMQLQTASNKKRIKLEPISTLLDNNKWMFIVSIFLIFKM